MKLCACEEREKGREYVRSSAEKAKETNIQ